MVGVLLILLLVGVGVFALLWSGSLIAQGYLYESTADDLVWRAAGGAGAVAVFLGLWCLLHAHGPETFDSLFSFSTTDLRVYDQIISVKERANGLPPVETVYTKRVLPSGQIEYRDRDGRPWRRSDSGRVVAIKVRDDDHECTFVPDPASLDEQGNFRSEAVVFVEEGGDRTMTETDIGKTFRTRPGRLVSNLVINGLHFAVWFAVFWLLLRYNWGHALGMAAAFWLATTLLVLPLLFR
jgi:hypothetical protein